MSEPCYSNGAWHIKGSQCKCVICDFHNRSRWKGVIPCRRWGTHRRALTRPRRKAPTTAAAVMAETTVM